MFVDGMEWIEGAKSGRNTGPAANRRAGSGYSGMIAVADAGNPGFVGRLPRGPKDGNSRYEGPWPDGLPGHNGHWRSTRGPPARQARG